MANPLPWIKLYASLPGHEKSGRLAKALGNDRAWTHVIELWLWASQHQPDGNLDSRTDTAIGIAAGWYENPSKFTAALRDVGFLDATGQLHGWEDKQGAHVEKLKADRDRKKADRDAEKKAKAERPVEVPADSPMELPSDSPSTVHATLSKNQRVEILDLRKKIQEHTQAPPVEPYPPEPSARVLEGPHPEKQEQDPRPDPPMEDDPPASAPPRAPVTIVAAPTPTRPVIARPEASTGPRNVCGEDYPGGGWKGCPANRADWPEALRVTYQTLMRAGDLSGTWKTWERLPLHEREWITEALRAHPLASEPDPVRCLTTEVVAGIRSDPFFQRPAMQKFKSIINPGNIEIALNAARNRAKGIDPNAKQAPKAPTPRVEEWRPPVFIPDSPEVSARAREENRPKFLGHKPDRPTNGEAKP